MSPTRLHVTERGIARAAIEVDAISRRLTDLSPAGYLIRRRWLESERRAFAAVRWKSRKAATNERYSRPGVSSGIGASRHAVSAPGGTVLVLSGRLKRGLTRPQAAGQMDRVQPTSGGLRVTLGVKAQGPLGYANTLARRGRDPVAIDPQAVADATDDITQYLVLGRAGR